MYDQNAELEHRENYPHPSSHDDEETQLLRDLERGLLDECDHVPIRYIWYTQNYLLL